MSVIMTDVKMKTKPARKHARRKPAAVQATFTVRDLNRRPQVVLNAARKLGRVDVQSRSGEKFTLKPERTEPQQSDLEHREEFHRQLKAMHAKMREEGSTGFTAEGWEIFSKMIAGEA